MRSLLRFGLKREEEAYELGILQKSKVRDFEGPSHVLQLLQALQSHSVTVEKVRSLWEILKWGAHKNVALNSKHPSQSLETMASLLVQVRLFEEAEDLLFALESNEIFYELVKGHVAARDWEKGVFVYDVMKGRGKVPSKDCYGVLIDLLVKVKRMCLASRVAFDFVDLGVPLSGDEVKVLEKVSSLVFDEIAFGYCEKRDFKDLLSFFVEVKCAPSVTAANRVVNSLCSSYGVERAGLFLQELESLGFSPDEVTYGILIGWSCREGKTRNALSCLSVMLLKSFVPHVYTYNALISGLFKLGMLDHARDIVDEMIEWGYCLIFRLSESLLRAIVKSMVPNFNSFVRKECSDGNLKNALVLVEEMLCWGQELLFPEFSNLVRQLCSSLSQIKSMTKLLEQMPKSAHKLDPETLNLVVQAYSKKGLLSKAKIILDGMLQNEFHVKNETYTAILMPLCKKGNMKDFSYYWDVACRNKWLPGLEDFKCLLVHICHWKMLQEASQFLEIMLLSYLYLKSDICHVFLEVLSSTGLTDTALVVLKQLQPCFNLDHTDYNHLIRGLCNEGIFSLAFTVLDDMLDRCLAPCLDVSVLLIPQLCKAHRYHKAIALKDIILKEQPSFSHAADCALICGFCNMGSTGKADTLFHDMFGHCQVNDLRKVGELLGVAIRKDWELSLTSYKNLVRLVCRKGRVQFALSLKNLLLAQCPLDGLIIYNILMFYLLKDGNSLDVNKILTEMEEKKVVLDEVGHNFVVYGFLQCRDLSSSLHYLTTMISKGLKPSNRGLRKVISKLCDAGNLKKALELSQEMRLRGWMHDSSIQTSIVESLLLCGNIQGAETFLDRMGEESLNPDNINYDYLIKRFCQHGRLNKAVHLMNTMLKKHNIPVSTSYDFIIHGFCAQNKLDIALNFYSEMLSWNLKPRIDTVEMLLHRFCQDGKTELAEQFLVDMSHGGETPTRKMYCPVIKSYHMKKNLRKASELLQAMQENGYQPDFETHWSLISNLNSAKAKDTDNASTGFLSRLLFKSGFLQKK
ncbi:hypothetical protein AAZX31_18G103000 [Glycine max]